MELHLYWWSCTAAPAPCRRRGGPAPGGHRCCPRCRPSPLFRYPVDLVRRPVCGNRFRCGRGIGRVPGARQRPPGGETTRGCTPERLLGAPRHLTRTRRAPCRTGWRSLPGALPLEPGETGAALRRCDPPLPPLGFGAQPLKQDSHLLSRRTVRARHSSGAPGTGQRPRGDAFPSADRSCRPTVSPLSGAGAQPRGRRELCVGLQTVSPQMGRRPTHHGESRRPDTRPTQLPLGRDATGRRSAPRRPHLLGARGAARRKPPLPGSPRHNPRSPTDLPSQGTRGTAP